MPSFPGVFQQIMPDGVDAGQSGGDRKL